MKIDYEKLAKHIQQHIQDGLFLGGDVEFVETCLKAFKETGYISDARLEIIAKKITQASNRKTHYNTIINNGKSSADPTEYYRHKEAGKDGWTPPPEEVKEKYKYLFRKIQ